MLIIINESWWFFIHLDGGVGGAKRSKRMCVTCPAPFPNTLAEKVQRAS